MGQGPAGKKSWSKPELVVLVRGRPEEAVLDTCKSGFTQGRTGTSNSHTACLGGQSCPECAATAAS